MYKPQIINVLKNKIKSKGYRSIDKMFAFQLDPKRYDFYEANNFGDMIGPYIFTKKRSVSPQILSFEDRVNFDHFVTVGSIFECVTTGSIVWGTGFMFDHTEIPKPREILAVRGEFTYARLKELGIKAPEIFGDPGLLMPLYYKPNVEIQYELGVVPHYVNYEAIQQLGLNKDKIHVINPLDDLENVIRNILSCRYIVSSSLHGIILSHAYRKPVGWVSFEEKLAGEGFKFKDHFSSVGIPANTKTVEITKLKKEIENAKEIVESFPQPTKTGQIDELNKVCPF